MGDEPSQRVDEIRRTSSRLTTAISAISRNSTQEMAEAYPEFRWTKAYLYSSRVSVWNWWSLPPSWGLPPPKSSGSVNSWSPPIVEMTTVKTIVGRMDGTVTRRNVVQRLAP